jgi:DNA ligase (NAD+)
MSTSKIISDRVQQLQSYNAAYFKGKTIVSDKEYETLVEELRRWDSSNPFLQTLKKTTVTGSSVRHKVPMLSTEKAYTQDSLQRFVDRVLKEAQSIGVTKPQFRVTPKLDGMAGKDENGILASRGDGRTGTDITHIFDRGVVAKGGRNLGTGEIVMVKSYFEANFSNEFEHPRNMVTGCVNSDEVNASTQKALDAGMLHFVPYTTLANWKGSGEQLVATIQEITINLSSKVDYPLDGMVAEALDDRIKDKMGATNHHNRWQIAIKTKGETATTTVEDIGWQTGRTGVITPVLRVKPTKVSGATISNITAHHAGLVKDKKLGIGAEIKIIRSGEVIPKLEEVLTPAKVVAIPSKCPSCNTATSWENDFLLCTNHDNCPAQAQTRLLYFFKTISTAKGFGPSTIETVTQHKHTTLKAIFALTKSDFTGMDFGDKQSENLVQAMETAKNTPIEDARFLASFGIKHLGIGESRRLLQHHSFLKLHSLSSEDLQKIDGFGLKTASSIITNIKKKWVHIMHIKNLGFILESTPLINSKSTVTNPISGKTVMFTGKLEQGSRKVAEKRARALNAKPLSGVSKNLDYLIIGEKPTQSKINAADKLGIPVLTEKEYEALLTKKPT